VTSKNCWQQEALPSVTKLSEIGVINSGKGILVKSGRVEGNGALHYLWRAVDQGGVLFFLYFDEYMPLTHSIFDLSDITLIFIRNFGTISTAT
jgi:hypothetical protein